MPKLKSVSTLVLSLFLLVNIILVMKYYNIESPVRYVAELPYSSDYVVPNLVHFIRFGNSTLTFMEAVCILSALKNQKPYKLFVHSDQLDFNGGRYWQIVVEQRIAKGVVEIKYLPQPQEIYGKPYSKIWGLYHKSDTERLKILMKYGGIYLDNDMFVVNSLNKFRHYEMVLGWQFGGGISDQVIIASKHARFLRVWLESYKDYRGDSWFYNGGELPTKLLEERPYLVHRVESGLAEYKNTPKLIYYKLSQLWTVHYAIHLLIRHQKELLTRNLSDTAPYPVEFNETNIMKYEANIKYMVLSVYPIHNGERKARAKKEERAKYRHNRTKAEKFVISKHFNRTLQT